MGYIKHVNTFRNTYIIFIKHPRYSLSFAEFLIACFRLFDADGTNINFLMYVYKNTSDAADFHYTDIKIN